MSDRSRLPNRRAGEAITFEVDKVRFRAMANNFPGTDRMAELFLSGGKPGSGVDTAARDAAIVLSIALQHGTPLAVIYEALTKLPDGEPAGPVGMAIKLLAREG